MKILVEIVVLLQQLKPKCWYR